MNHAIRIFLLLLLIATSIAQGEAPDSPFSVAAVLKHKKAFDRPHDVELQGDLAFVPGKGGSLAIVDVAEPAQPEIRWHRHDAKGLHDAETVFPFGDWLLLGTDHFHPIDIRNPGQPVIKASISTTPQISRINGMVRKKSVVFAAGKNGVLAAFDVSQPASPKQAAALNIRKQFGIASPHDVDLISHYAVVPDPQGFGRNQKPGQLALIQVFKPKTGELLAAQNWKRVSRIATNELIGANRVQVSGHHAFVGASTAAQGGRLIVIDLSQAETPQQVASLPFAPKDGWGANGLAIAGHVVFLAGGQTIEAIDISDPHHPTKLARQRFPKHLQNANPRYAGGGDSGHDLVYRNGHVFVTGQNDNCLLILRVVSKRIRNLADQRPI